MARPSAPRGRGGWPAQDDDWGPSTAVYSSSAGRNGTAAGNPKIGRAFTAPPARAQRPADQWAPAGRPAARERPRASAADRRMAQSIDALRQRRARERGLPAWAALLLLIAVAALGGALDTLASIQVKGGFNIGIVVASVVAILAVKRSHMFPIVIAPPIVYSGAALFQLYVRSSGLHDKKVVLDAAANYLVYGFPAIAAATAAVLIVAGFRLISRK